MLPAETSNIAQVIDTQRILDLPLNGGQAQSLLFLAPGTINTTLYYCGSSCQGGVYPNAQWGNIGGGGPGNINSSALVSVGCRYSETARTGRVGWAEFCGSWGFLP